MVVWRVRMVVMWKMPVWVVAVRMVAMRVVAMTSLQYSRHFCTPPTPYTDNKCTTQRQTGAKWRNPLRVDATDFCMARVDSSASPTAWRNDAPAAPPNIALLFLDDFGWGDLGANTGESGLTPEMDRLAADGLRWTDWHVGFSVCTPSRAALLTGRYGARTGVTSNFGPGSIYGMAATELTMADILSEAGFYEAHMIGKWHLGHNAPYHPTYRGFLSWYGLPYSGDMGCLDSTPQGCHADWNRSAGQPACPSLCPDDEGRGGCGNGGSAESGCVAIPLYDTHGRDCGGVDCAQSIVEQPFDPFGLNARYAARAAALIDAHATNRSAEEHPLFLYVAFAHTHTPLAYAQRWENRTAHGEHSSVFVSTVAEVDWAVGEIRSAADRSGESWLVWLTADNGPADLASVACDSIGSPGPFAGAWQRSEGGGGGTCKGTTWEGGHRVMGITYWPGIVAPGSVLAGLAHTLDLLPTFAALAGVDLGRYDRAYDGIDLSPALERGDTSALADRTLFHQDGNGRLNAMRVGVTAVRLIPLPAAHVCVGGGLSTWSSTWTCARVWRERRLLRQASTASTASTAC